jgi:hypothetical protein
MISTFANPLDAPEPTLAASIEQSSDEAFMTLLLAMNDTRKRIAILCVLSFLALC